MNRKILSIGALALVLALAVLNNQLPARLIAQIQPASPIASPASTSTIVGTPVSPTVTNQPTAQVPQTPAAVATPGGKLPDDVDIRLVQVVEGLIDPVNVAFAPGDADRVFVVERVGTVRIVENGELIDTPFLDISYHVLTAYSEQGLYDLAFHPGYPDTPYVYVHFAELLRNGDSVVVRYTVQNPRGDTVQIDPASSRVILHIEQPWAHHNGGELAFGPDGYLYIGVGDGGWGGDPLDAAQDLSMLLGKILRIDVNVEGNQPYAIPVDNPFAQPAQLVSLGFTEEGFARIHVRARPEIWAYGLRNPWKFSFDPETGDLYLPDVGQSVWEEINWQPANSQSGTNYGWDLMMGAHCFPAQEEDCPAIGVLPIAEYSHQVGCAVIDLGIYRGQQYPELDGVYFVGDFCSGLIWGLERDQDGTWQMEELLNTDLLFTGGDLNPASGELYVTTCWCAGESAPEDNPPGALWRIVPSDRVPRGATVATTETPIAEPQEQGEQTVTPTTMPFPTTTVTPQS